MMHRRLTGGMRSAGSDSERSFFARFMQPSPEFNVGQLYSEKSILTSDVYSYDAFLTFCITGSRMIRSCSSCFFTVRRIHAACGAHCERGRIRRQNDPAPRLPGVAITAGWGFPAGRGDAARAAGRLRRRGAGTSRWGVRRSRRNGPALAARW